MLMATAMERHYLERGFQFLLPIVKSMIFIARLEAAQ